MKRSNDFCFLVTKIENFMLVNNDFDFNFDISFALERKTKKIYLKKKIVKFFYRASNNVK